MTVTELIDHLHMCPSDYYVYAYLPDAILTLAWRSRTCRVPLLSNADSTTPFATISIIGPLSADEHAKLEMALRCWVDEQLIARGLAATRGCFEEN